MKKLKTLRIEEDLLARVEAIEPNFNRAVVESLEQYVGETITVNIDPELAKHIAAGHHKRHHGRQGNGETVDTPPARKRSKVAPSNTPPSDGAPQERAGSSPASPAKLEAASQAVSAIGEKVVPAAVLRYQRPEHDPQTCRNPYCLVCKAMSERSAGE